MSFSVLLIGLGQVGIGYDLDLDPKKYIYTHARAFDLHSNFHLIAGVDPNVEKCAIFEKTYQCPSYLDTESALYIHRPQVVVIAAPTPLHSEMLHSVLRHSSPLAILCEKPLSYNVAEAQMIVESCKHQSVDLFVNYIRRSIPAVLEVKKRIDVGEIIPPIKGTVWYSKGFLHNASHFFNLLEYWLGPVQASGPISYIKKINEFDVELDTSVSFAKGSAIFISTWEKTYSYYSVELFSQNGRLHYQQDLPYMCWQEAQPDIDLTGSTLMPNPEKIIINVESCQLNVVNELSKYLNNQDSEICTGLEALTTLISMENVIGLKK